MRAITFEDRVRQRWQEDMEGVVVTDVTPGGWAALAGLRGDDLLLSVQDHALTSPEQLAAVMAKAVDGRPRFLRIFVRRGNRTAFIFVEPDWSQYTGR